MTQNMDKSGGTPFYKALENLQLDLIRRSVAVIGDSRAEARAILERNIETMDHLSDAIRSARQACSHAEGLKVRAL